MAVPSCRLPSDIRQRSDWERRGHCLFATALWWPIRSLPLLKVMTCLPTDVFCRVYDLDGEDSRTLAVIGTFRVVPEQDLDTVTTPCAHLRDEGLVNTVDLGRDERVLTKERAEHSYSKCRR